MEIIKPEKRDVHPDIPELEDLYLKGRITRREFLRNATLLGMSFAGASALLAACAPATAPEEPAEEAPAEEPAAEEPAEEGTMAVEVTENGRVRAWVLVEADPPEDVAQAIYDALGYEGGDDWVVVRADVVADHQGYNLVVPVDAKTTDHLAEVLSAIEDTDGVNGTLVLQVTRHIPKPPHDAHGYITLAEAEEGKEKIFGRLGNSPGANAWG
jgi:hypothetical protein